MSANTHWDIFRQDVYVMFWFEKHTFENQDSQFLTKIYEIGNKP